MLQNTFSSQVDGSEAWPTPCQPHDWSITMIGRLTGQQQLLGYGKEQGQVPNLLNAFVHSKKHGAYTQRHVAPRGAFYDSAGLEK